MKNKAAWENFKERHCSMVKHLIVFCHPDCHSLSAAYKDEVVRLTEKSGHCAIVRDLYNIGFHPELTLEDMAAIRMGDIPVEIKLEQDYILEADLITLIYPIWWTGMPAVMKGYIDRVFSNGFAYEVGPSGELRGLLNGKKVMILNNFGHSFDYYEETGILDALRKTSDTGIFDFCGMNVVGHHFFGHLNGASREERNGHIKILPSVYEKFLPSR